MLRVIAIACGPLVCVAMACAGESKQTGGAAPPPGAGYGSSSPLATDEVRVLSRDDCLALRDHQIDITVAAATVGRSAGERLEVEARVRAEMKSKTDEWVKSCSGRRVPAKLLRCWKDASTPSALLACDAGLDDAGVDATDGG